MQEQYERTPFHRAAALPSVTTGDLPLLRQGSLALGLSLTDEQIGQFARYRTELIEWNGRFNLTSITDPAEIEVRHFLDSLTLVAALPPTDLPMRGLRIADVGSGAGLPGIPLALLFPHHEVTLIEATGKKCRFLDHVVGVLGIANVTIRCGRAEDLARDPTLREQFAVVVARAVAALPALVECELPFARPGGRAIAMKKTGIEAEVAEASFAIEALGGRPLPPLVVRLPILDEDRLLIVIEKASSTPTEFPRRAGIPVKSPLLGRSSRT